MEPKIMVFPHRYVQGPDILSSISEHLLILGVYRPMFLLDPSVIDACREPIQNDFGSRGMKCRFLSFRGESTWAEVARVKEACIEGDHDAIISCGGGKTLDTGRAATAGNAINCGVVPPEPIDDLGAGVACIQVPTIASTDASNDTRSAFIKFALRKTIDFAIVNCAAMVTTPKGNVSDARICLNSVFVKPYRALKAEEAIIGIPIDEGSAEIAGNAAVSEAKPLKDNGYMVQIAKALVKKCILALK